MPSSKAPRMSISHGKKIVPPPKATRHIKNPWIKRLARRGGTLRLEKEAYDETRKQLHEFISEILKNSIELMEHCRRKTVTKEDVVEALKRKGMKIYE